MDQTVYLAVKAVMGALTVMSQGRVYRVVSGVEIASTVQVLALRYITDTSLGFHLLHKRMTS